MRKGSFCATVTGGMAWFVWLDCDQRKSQPPHGDTVCRELLPLVVLVQTVAALEQVWGEQVPEAPGGTACLQRCCLTMRCLCALVDGG